MRILALTCLLAACNTSNFGAGGPGASGAQPANTNPFANSGGTINGASQTQRDAANAAPNSVDQANTSGGPSGGTVLGTASNPNGTGGTTNGVAYGPGETSLALNTDNFCSNGDVQSNNNVAACYNLDPGMPAVAEFFSASGAGTPAGSVSLTGNNGAFLNGLINSIANLSVPAGLPDGQYVIALCVSSGCTAPQNWAQAAAAAGQPAAGCGKSAGLDTYSPTDQCREQTLIQALKNASGVFGITDGPVTISGGKVSGEVQPTLEVLFCKVNLDSPFGAMFTINVPNPTNPIFTNVPYNSGEYPGCTQSHDPLLIDLSGAGIEMSSVGEGVQFDVEGIGTPAQVAWPKPGNYGFLVYDHAHTAGQTAFPVNGVVDDGRELFGNYTEIGGKIAADGFAALRFYADGGNVIDASHPIFDKLAIWIDRNHDGKTDPGELISLRAAHIRSLSLDTTGSRLWYDDNGNFSRKQAVVTMDDGSTRTMFDVWVNANAPR